jgi:hypothetical protein
MKPTARADVFNPKAPLWLPYGSVRALLALALVFVFCVGFMQGTIPSDAFVPVVVAVASFYFGAKSATNPNEPAP